MYEPKRIHCNTLSSARVCFCVTGAPARSGMVDFSAHLCSGFDVSIVLHSVSCCLETKISILVLFILAHVVVQWANLSCVA